MRIVMTTDTIGGVWTFTQELCAGLLEQGCDIALVSLGSLPAPRHERWVRSMETMWGERFGFTALNTGLEWMQENEDALDGAAQELIDIAAEFNAGLFHFNQFCFGALHTDLPKVVTAHSDVLSWATYCHIEDMEDSGWLRQYRALVASGLAHADAVIAPTRWMLRAVADNFDLPRDQYVIPNGRDVSPGPAVARKLQAVSAGRLWDKAKNVALLSRISSSIPILTAGETSCMHGDAPELGDVLHLGSLGEEELFALFRESALYLCTSIYEPFGLAPLEAALCGCAILANDIPSLREVWGDGALYFKDASSLSRLLARFDNDRELVFAAQARSRARSGLYTRDKMARAYMQVFSHAVTSAKDSKVANAA